MKKRLCLTLACLLFAGLPFLLAQGFKPPADGKAVVYFVRVTSLGFAVGFQYFDQDKYIGLFKGKSYFRYECDPGKHLLWASSENKEFLTADLKAGGTYVVIVDVAMGIGKARVGLTPVGDTNTEAFKRARGLVHKKPPEVNEQEKIDKMQVKLKGFMADKLKMYEEHWKAEKNFKSIEADMALSEDALK